MCECHRPEQTTLCRLVQQHAATFIAQTEAAAGADLPQFVKDEFDAVLQCGMRFRAKSTAVGRWPSTTKTPLRTSTQGPGHPIAAPAPR